MWKREMVTTERGTFEVFVSGYGKPLCVTHLYSEFNERGNRFADMFTGLFKVYLVNLKEAGNSDKVQDENELSMKETIKDLEALREELNIPEWGFAGHSTGGMLGLVYAATSPNSLNKLLVGGATATNNYMEHKDSIYSKKNILNRRLKEILSILNSSESTKEERNKASREWTEMSLYDPSKFDEYFSKPSSGKVVQVRLDYYSYHELPNYDIREVISKIKIPTVVFCGKFDAQCPIVYSEEIRSLIPNAKLYIFEQSNHNPFLEEEEKFMGMVNEFQANYTEVNKR